MLTAINVATSLSKIRCRFNFKKGRAVWKFAITALNKKRTTTLAAIAKELSHLEGIQDFSITPAHN